MGPLPPAPAAGEWARGALHDYSRFFGVRLQREKVFFDYNRLQREKVFFDYNRLQREKVFFDYNCLQR
jgi:hypothetical protein